MRHHFLFFLCQQCDRVPVVYSVVVVVVGSLTPEETEVSENEHQPAVTLQFHSSVTTQEERNTQSDMSVHRCWEFH